MNIQFYIGKQSLARQALFGMALRITLLIVIATGVSYWHMQRTLHASILKNLSNYVDLRGKAESQQFMLAERQTKMLRDEFLLRLQSMGAYDPQVEFDQVFVRDTDGLIRVRSERNDYRHHATAYLRHDVALTPDLRRRFFIGWQLMDQWGPILTNRFFSGFMNMPEQLSINFCPSADWGRSATRETDITIYETVWRATIEKNPRRLPFWTTVYYDPGADTWMVSCVTPGDHNGRWVVTGGQDVAVSDLIKRTIANSVEEGTWNFIVDSHANLIAHPYLTEKIIKAGGNLQISQLGDSRLTAMVDTVLSMEKKAPFTLEPSGQDVFLGVSRITGPGWYFVTVYPKKLLTTQALATARIFLIVGFSTLLLELTAMATILHRRIAVPIAQTVSATERISLGDFNVRLDTRQNDELGILAAAVNRMGEAVGERDAALSRQFAQLKEARQIQQEQQKRECIGTLAGGIAHDFNNILGAIIGYTDLALMREKGDDGWRSELEEIRKASNRATALVRQILSFSRKQPQEKKPVQISLIIKEAMKLLRASIPSTIEIQQDIDSNVVVLAEPVQIHQVIMNLCTNAYQAMSEHGGVLRVFLEEIVLKPETMRSGLHLSAGRYVRLSVSDTGCGMDQETREKIFDPYFTTKEQSKGTGLGLAVAHGIIESHNGLILVQSEPGHGSIFTVYLPVADHETEAEYSVLDLPVTVGKAHGKVMFVDDESFLRELFSKVLTKAGYHVDVFVNGKEAWLALSQRPDNWDLLVTDQTMPEMTGDQLALKVLSLRPDMPVILCSGYSASLQVDQVKRAGVFAFLEKPLDIHELLLYAAKAVEAKA